MRAWKCTAWIVFGALMLLALGTGAEGSAVVFAAILAGLAGGLIVCVGGMLRTLAEWAIKDHDSDD